MRKLVAWVFMYSLDGLLADEGTEYWDFCFGLPDDPGGPGAATRRLPERVRAHHGPSRLRGHGQKHADGHRPPLLPHPDRRRKVVFSRTQRTAEWANTTIAAGDTAEEIDHDLGQSWPADPRAHAADPVTEFDPETHEPGTAWLLTPLYRHDQAPAETGR
jgi:hypothetical protein